MIYTRFTGLYILLDEDELLCWTGSHSPEKSIFVDSAAQSHALYKCILACYCHFPLGDATHSRVALVEEVPLLAECHSCKMQLQPVTSKCLCSCVLGQVSFPNFCHVLIMLFKQKIESSSSFLPSSHLMHWTLCLCSHFWDKSVHLYTEKEFNFLDTGQKAEGLNLMRSFMHCYDMESMLSSREKSVSNPINCWYMFSCYQKKPNAVWT